MKDMVMNVVRQCPFYLKYKINNKSYGHLPPNNNQHLDPWDELHVDMIRSWKVIIKIFEYQFRAVTCIGALINLPEIIPVDNARSRTVVEAFEDHWLSRFPRPLRCIHNNGNEFLGPEFS